MKRQTTPVPCAHIALFYQRAWEQHHCIGNNLLRHGYAQWSRGEIQCPENNLFQWPRGRRLQPPPARLAG